MMKITINGTSIETSEGKTVFEAAHEAGIYIPNLCWDPDLKPYGGCRLCIVQIEKMRGFPTACTTPAKDGMVITTENETLSETRKGIIDLLLSDHPIDCLMCSKNQSCELQKVSAYLGMNERSFLHSQRKQQIDTSNPFFTLDRNYCILCARCVRTCDEITGVNAIEISNRGYESKVGSFADRSIFESICRSCGECVVHCPVGALVSKENVIATGEVDSVCPYCGVGCGLYLGIRNGKIVAVRGNRNNKASRGRLCVKGRYGIKDFVHRTDRLQKPLIRKNGKGSKLVETSWDTAMKFVASKLKSYTPDQIAVIASAKATNEDNYIIQKFTRGILGTNNIDHCARLCHAPSVTGLVKTFGSGAMTNSISDLSQSRCVMSIGSNTTETHPVIGFDVKQAAKKDTKIIIANPRRIELVRYADIWLQQRPGSDTMLLLAMIKTIIEEKLYDKYFIEERCENFTSLVDSLENFSLETAAAYTGVPSDQIVAAAQMYATNSPAAILYAMGITQHTHGTDNVIAIANLSMLTGNIGKPGAGVNPLRGQNNVQGACDMGSLPNVFPGYQKVDEPLVQKKFESAWGVNIPDKAGLTIPEIFQAIDKGRIKALYLIGENPVLSDADSEHVRLALKKLDLFVAQDIFINESNCLADVLFAANTFAEKDGTFTNTERRVQKVNRAINPVGDSKADWQITSELARTMGANGFDFTNSSQIMDEIAFLTPSYRGISHERLNKEGGIQWPCPSTAHPGTPILHTKEFTRGKGRFLPVEYKAPDEEPDDEYPLILTTGRSLFHYHTGTMSRRVEGLNILKAEEEVEINPIDAKNLGVNTGDTIRIISRRGEITAKAKVSDVSGQGTIFMTFHFHESPTNILTNPAIDPVAKIPELKFAAVRIETIK